MVSRGNNVDRHYKLPYAADYQKLPELAELVVGKAVGRTNRDQVTLFVINMGLGIQFAATALAVWEAARRAGIGSEIDDEYFLYDRHVL